ncbi:MAG: DUF4290 domain-containing protein [Chitinophagales bacterium]|nr:DUF4290 domain-containing protein [Chitinophagales bacterium]
MEYNSSRNHIEMREYGRYIQKLVNHAMTIQDRDQRLKACEAIIEIMGTLNPHLKFANDYREKIWDHLYVISGFQLDVDWPFGQPSPEVARIKPVHLPYPKNRIKFRHYGKNVETMVLKASEMEDGDKKLAFTELIGNFMKMAYKTWSNEEVSLELVKEDMKSISSGELEISEEMNIESFAKLTRGGNNQSYQHKNKNKNKNKNRSNGNYKQNNNNSNRKRY